MLKENIKQTCEHAAKKLFEKRNRLFSECLDREPFAFMQDHTRLLDDYFRESFERSMIGPNMEIVRNPYTVIALGGYGRQEQCVHSDVDVLFLFKKEVPEKAEALIREMLYPLWDIGLDIGHATRSLKECIALAGKDHEVMASLLDARFICGMSPLYSEMMHHVRERIVFRRSHKIVDQFIRGSRERHRVFGDSAWLLEPNLKEGQGGLRDYHTMLWIGRIRFGLLQPRDLEYQGCLSHAEYESLSNALAFLWKVRNSLHLLTGRKYEQLHFDYQVKLAARFNCEGADERESVENFLGQLHGRMDEIRQAHLGFIHDQDKSGKWFDFRRRSAPKTTVNGLESLKTMIGFVSSEHIFGNPALLMQIFEESARLRIPLNAEARRLVRDFADMVADRPDGTSPGVVQAFERILTARLPENFDPLEEMFSCGLMSRFIPEIEAVTNRIEFDTYHIYPVCKHLLHTVRVLKCFGMAEDRNTDPLVMEVYREITDRELLLWAALLHDIGKGDPDSDHSVSGAATARRIMTRKGYSPEDADTVAFLVREHLLLYAVATRRDIDDPETLEYCAERIASRERLKMLYLLTLADLIATGPKAWNDWTAVLLRELFFRVLKYLDQGGIPEGISGEKANEILAQARSGGFPDTMEQMLEIMSPRYLRTTPSSRILDHIRLSNRLGENRFVWEIARKPDSGDTRIVTICGRDEPGFFSKIAGVFALNRIQVYDAQVHTWRNHIVLNIFHVSPPPDRLFEDERWDRAERELRAVLSGKLNLLRAMDERIECDRKAGLGGLTMPGRINIDNTSSGAFTIIEVFAQDSPGLLFRLTDALLRCRLDIWSAQIATVGEQVVDVFYVRDFDGRKAELPDHAEQIKASVHTILQESYTTAEQKTAKKRIAS